jgi:hypothetical protein
MLHQVAHQVVDAEKLEQHHLQQQQIQQQHIHIEQLKDINNDVTLKPMSDDSKQE